MSKLPCKSCPWRVENDASCIPNYSQKKAEGLLSTVGRGDGFYNVMSCHLSQEGKEVACKGYLAQVGYDNLNVRLMLIKKEIENPFEIADACDAEGIDLEPDYETVLEKLSCHS